MTKVKELFSAIRGRLFSDNWWEAFLLKRRAPLADFNIEEIEIELCSRLFPISIDKISSGPEYLKKTERYINLLLIFNPHAPDRFTPLTHPLRKKNADQR